MSEEFISTTALSKKLEIEVSDLFTILQNLKWLKRDNEKWILTSEGSSIGGIIKKNDKIGDYIAWPSSIPLEEINNAIKQRYKNLVTASTIAEKISISAQRMNLIFSELGWIEKDEKRGWEVTKLGKFAGGRQREHEDSAKLYVLWPDNILENKSLLESLRENHIGSLPDTIKEDIKPESIDQKEISFRDKYPANLRTFDGHLVRSRAEVIIDNLLYQYGLPHAYERKLPIEEDVYSDFYIPNGKKVYIEFWGMENDEQYKARKNKKIEIYKQRELNLIELHDDDITRLDDVLPAKLLKFDIKVY